MFEPGVYILLTRYFLDEVNSCESIFSADSIKKMLNTFFWRFSLHSLFFSKNEVSFRNDFSRSRKMDRFGSWPINFSEIFKVGEHSPAGDKYFASLLSSARRYCKNRQLRLKSFGQEKITWSKVKKRNSL